MVVPDFRRATLPVISARAVLAEKVFVQKFGLHRTRGRMKAQGFACQPNKVFQYNRIVNRVRQGTAPGEWAVARHQYGLAFQRVAPLERFDDDLTRIAFVIGLDLLRGELTCAGDGTVKMIGVRGSQRG